MICLNEKTKTTVDMLLPNAKRNEIIRENLKRKKEFAIRFEFSFFFFLEKLDKAQQSTMRIRFATINVKILSFFFFVHFCFPFCFYFLMLLFIFLRCCFFAFFFKKVNSCNKNMLCSDFYNGIVYLTCLYTIYLSK